MAAKGRPIAKPDKTIAVSMRSPSRKAPRSNKTETIGSAKMINAKAAGIAKTNVRKKIQSIDWWSDWRSLLRRRDANCGNATVDRPVAINP